MAQHDSASSKQMTAAEMQQWIQDHERQLRNYEAANDALKQLRDVAKGSVKRVTSLSKDTVIGYLQNPTSNEANLRNVSWYLFYRSILYQRLITYYSSLFCLDARTVIPPYDLVKPDSDEKILKSYNDTLKMLSNWNINNEFLKVITTCFLQDVSYNVAYYDDTGLYFLPLPADYCRIYAQYPEGDFAIAFDCSYLRGTNNWLVEAWGEPFTSMYRAFETEGNAGRWQIIPPEYSCTLKFFGHDWEQITPVFSGLFSDLIMLNDIADIQALADEQEIYRLVYMKLQTITGAKMPDEWAVDPAVAVDYFNRFVEDGLPSYTSAAIVPTNDDLGVIDFSNTDRASETNKVLRTTKAVLNTSGGAQILNSADIAGSTAYHSVLHADENFAMTPLLYQIQGWFNRILPNVVSNPSTVKFFFVGRLTKDEYRKELLEDAQYSLPTKLATMSLSGIDPLDALSLNHLENDILNLGDKFNSPLQSSYTSTGNNEGGRPALDDDEITADGESSRDKADTAG